MAVFYIDSPSQGILELSSTTDIQVNKSSTPSKFKLETGETISDNVVADNIQISFSGIISNIRSIYATTNQDDGKARAFFQDPVKGYLEALENIRQSKELFTVRYDSRFLATNNCIITNITSVRNASTGLGYNINLSFEQIRISGRATTSTIRSIQKFPDTTQDQTNSGSNNQKKVTLNDGSTASKTVFGSLGREILDLGTQSTLEDLGGQ